MNFRKILQKGLIGLLLGASLTAKAQNHGEAGAAGNGYDGRAKAEYSGNARDSHMFTTTLGFAPHGAYTNMPTALNGQFAELGQVKTIYEKTPGYELHTTALGFKMPELKIGNTKTKIINYEALGDRDGAGIEANTCYKNTKLNFLAEHGFKNDTTRIGGGVYHKTGKLGLALGYDHLSNPADEAGQYFARAIYFPTKNDAAGIAIASTDSEVNKKNSVGAFYVHYGKGKVGMRAYQNTTWDEKGNKTFAGHFIGAQNNLLGPGGASALIDRIPSEGGTYNVSPFPVALSPVEAIRVPDRTEKGLAGCLSWKYNDFGTSKSGTIGAEAAYRFNSKWGVSQGVSYNFSNTKGDSVTANPGILYRKGNLEVDVGASIPIKGDIKPGVRAAVQVSF